MRTSVGTPLLGVWLGRRRYAEVLVLQESLFESNKLSRGPNVALFVEHEPVVTLGRGAHDEHLLASRSELERLGVSLHPANRGGDVTLHAPGQLVAYPIVALEADRRDVRKYVRALERVMQRLVAPSGVEAGPFAPHVGLWADQAAPGRFSGEGQLGVPVKLGAIGVRISRWTTMHGFALNLSTDLSLYRVIVPCGIAEHGVASVASLVGHAPDVESSARQAQRELAFELGFEPGEYLDRSSAELGGLPHELGLHAADGASGTTIA
jgi:lipoyl(octanoyl) transferase